MLAKLHFASTFVWIATRCCDLPLQILLKIVSCSIWGPFHSALFVTAAKTAGLAVQVSSISQPSVAVAAACSFGPDCCSTDWPANPHPVGRSVFISTYIYTYICITFTNGPLRPCCDAFARSTYMARYCSTYRRPRDSVTCGPGRAQGRMTVNGPGDSCAVALLCGKAKELELGSGGRTRGDYIVNGHNSIDGGCTRLPHVAALEPAVYQVLLMHQRLAPHQ